MTEQNIKNAKKTALMVQLIDENQLKLEMGEAFASYMLNPTVTWAKFILTDDLKNANGERIPKEEFENIIKSGIHMPVKMAIGEISPGHPGTKPLGSITHLKEVSTEDGVSMIVALAALWGHERPADVEFIKKRYAEGKSVDISWEILYEDAIFNPEFESMDLLGTVLSAATVVGNPAYSGRTPFLSIAAKKVGQATIEADPENLSEDISMEMDELKTKVTELEAKVSELETTLAESKSQLETSNTAVAEKDAEIARLVEESKQKDEELAPLKELKASIDAENDKKEKLAAIKTKFSEAGLEKEESYFDENADKLMKMDDEILSFYIQESLANLSEEHKSTSASTKTKKIPAFNGESEDEGDLTDPKTLGRLLREQRSKK